MSTQQEKPTVFHTDESRKIDTITLSLQQTMEKFLATGSVESVYGKPIQQGNTIVIPSAEVLVAMGYGIGGGYNQVPTHDNTSSDPENLGGGGGGGGRILSRPVAIVVITPEEVRVDPIVDITKVAIAFLTTIGFTAGLIHKMKSRKK